MQVLVYEMEMDDFGVALLESDSSFKLEKLYELDQDPLHPLQLKYMVRVTETRVHEEGGRDPNLKAEVSSYPK